MNSTFNYFTGGTLLVRYDGTFLFRPWHIRGN